MTKPASVVRRIGAVSAAKAKTAKKTVALVRGPLVFASRSLNNEATPCIAFAYLTSYLHAHGYDVVWVDAIGQGLNQTSELPKHPGYSIQGLTFEEVLERIPDDVAIVGFSGMFSGEWPVLFGLKLAVRGVDEVSINIFSPYPGTELFDGLLSEEAIEVNDSYFLKLTSLNSDYTSINPLTVNSAMGPRELGLYRIGFMLANYALGYLIYPRRIIRTLRNLRSKHDSSTVLEHRLKDAIRRRTGRKTQQASGEDRHAA